MLLRRNLQKKLRESGNKTNKQQQQNIQASVCHHHLALVINVPHKTRAEPTTVFISIDSWNNTTDHKIAKISAIGLFAIATESGTDFKTICHKKAYAAIENITIEKHKKYNGERKSCMEASFENTLEVE